MFKGCEIKVGHGHPKFGMEGYTDRITYLQISRNRREKIISRY